MIPAVPELLTPRFRLRALEERDVAVLWPTFSDADAMRYWSRAAFTSQKELRDWLFDGDWGGRTWIAEDKTGGDALCRIVASSDSEGVAEIGYLTVLGQQGQGIAGECVAALIEQLFAGEKYHRIWADIDPDNHASNALVRKLGFQQEGHLRDAMKTHIGWRDTLVWGLLASDW